MAEPKKEKKPKKPVRTPALQEPTPGALLGAAAAAEATDPFLSRNEFKRNFYNQLSQPAIDAETMYGKGTKRGFEYPTVIKAFFIKAFMLFKTVITVPANVVVDVGGETLIYSGVIKDCCPKIASFLTEIFPALYFIPKPVTGSK
jgi:hypothetical protein